MKHSVLIATRLVAIVSVLTPIQAAAQTSVPQAEPPAAFFGSDGLQQLRQSKKQSLDELDRRARQIARLWKQRQARDALVAAKLHAQQQEQNRQAKSTVTLNLKNQTQSKSAVLSSPAKTSANAEAPQVAAPPQPVAARPHTPGVIAVDRVLPQQAVATQVDEGISSVLPPPENGTAETQADDSETFSELVDGPIDRMALASSLFATHRWKECLRTLEAIDLKNINDENRHWLQYVDASCHRKLGNLPEAESSYRKLLSMTKRGWIADAGRWWLDHMNELQKTGALVDQLQSQNEAWRTELKNLASEGPPGV